jgi:NAD(P)-dependent dehydrogenase (short-subunit alcohol dehydrogenase family)
VNQPSPVTNICGFADAASRTTPIPSLNGWKETTFAYGTRKLLRGPVKYMFRLVIKLHPVSMWTRSVRATAIAFAREGARVAVAEINTTAGEETAHLAGNGAIAIRTDVTDPDGLQAAIRRAVDHFGALHVLHNNAGGSTPEDNTAVDAPLDEFWRVIRLDLFGTFLGCRFGIPELIRAGGGSVINMASNLALMGIAGRDCYTAAKGGIAALTRSLAVEFAAQRVRVNAIAPSATMTDRVRKLMAGNAAIDRLARSHLLGLIEPADIANAAIYLASEESRMVTGQILPVDSGVTIS